MPTHLTRHVFRRILANEPIIHRGCLRRQTYTSLARIRTGSRRCVPQHGRPSRYQRRSLFDFNMFAPKKREVKEVNVDPGIEDMMHLAKMQRMKARLPPAKDVADALKAFFAAKREQRKKISDTQARLALQSFKYCFANEDASKSDGTTKRVGKDYDYQLGMAMINAVSTVAAGASATTSAHVELAEFLHTRAQEITAEKKPSPLKTAFAYAATLSCVGRASDARDLAEKLGEPDTSARTQSTVDVAEHAEEQNTAHVAAENAVLAHGKKQMERSRAQIPKIWAAVLRGFARENNEEELLATMTTIQTQEWYTGVTAPMASAMLSYYLQTDRIDAVQTWHEQYWRTYEDILGGEGENAALSWTSSQLDRHVSIHLEEVLRWCLLHHHLDFGHQVVRRAMANNPPKLVWDAILVWAAGTGKGADEIGRMLDVMEKSNDDISDPTEWRVPDIATINGLVEFATSKQDPYLAERFIVLGKSRQIEPDARTYQLQIQYRLKISDVDGALIAYKSLQAMDLSSNEDVPAVNNLIVALCQSKRHDFDTVMNVAMDLADRRAHFDPATVTALALLHLNRDEMHDVIDLLNTHAHHYSSADRSQILNTILAFCLDPSTPTSRSWDAYKILGSVFDEMPREPRTQVMSNFYTRHKRPDMAVFIFNEMRRHSRADTIPTVDTYVASFLGSAKLRDLDSLEVIHNQLKLDYNINTTTYLMNAMMISYTACDRPRLALGFWNDIVASKEGPTYNSIHIALRACEKAPFGDLRAKEIWTKLRKMDVELDQKLWAAYAGALVGNGDNESAFELIEAAEEKRECEVDAVLLGSMVDGATTEAKQAEVESWAREKFSTAWEELEKIGFEMDEESQKRVPNIDRSVTP